MLAAQSKGEVDTPFGNYSWSLTPLQCDESQPCRPCASLNLECKFERPSRRRGPPNRHAESLKRQKLDPSGQSGPSSPTHAAQTLASFAQQQVLSIEAIALPTVVSPLIDDYFTYLHPMSMYKPATIRVLRAVSLIARLYSIVGPGKSPLVHFFYEEESC